ncbi:MAG: stage II sporulation protein M [Methanolinea sp.]|nr:stage II sporulation protein M [Methanolinea sp.]
MSDLARESLAAVVILCISLAMGMLTAMQDPSTGERIMSLLRETVLGDGQDVSPPLLAAKLFLNNLQACLLMFLGGASLGVLTVFIITVNGFAIGAVLELVREQHSPLFVAAALLPHGIFEIPAFVLSGALGFTLARALWHEWTAGTDAAAEAAALGRIFVSRVVPLVAVAALVEAFITPAILHFLV